MAERKEIFPNYKNTLGGKVPISFQTLLQTCGLECPRLQELLLPCLCPSEPSSLLPIVITPLQSDHPLQNTEVLQSLLNQTPLSHLTGSCYSEVATGLSALCSSEGGCYLSLKTQELVQITGSIPCLSPFCQSTQIGVEGIAADRCCAGLKRGHSSDNIREREAVLGSESSWPRLAWRVGNTQEL